MAISSFQAAKRAREVKQSLGNKSNYSATDVSCLKFLTDCALPGHPWSQMSAYHPSQKTVLSSFYIDCECLPTELNSICNLLNRMHALKDEMFLRTSLQRQSAKLQHAAINYAVSFVHSLSIDNVRWYAVKCNTNHVEDSYALI